MIGWQHVAQGVTDYSNDIADAAACAASPLCSDVDRAVRWHYGNHPGVGGTISFDADGSAGNRVYSVQATVVYGGANAPTEWPPGALLYEDFENGLSQWRGQTGDAPETATVVAESSAPMVGDIADGAVCGGTAWRTWGECRAGTPTGGIRVSNGGLLGTPITTLDECVAACAAQCPDTCNYVSFSDVNADCSWYSECDLANPPLTIAHYQSVAVGTNTFGGHGNVLRLNACSSGGDAFSVATVDCSLAAPCLVEYDTKGRAWQGFSDGFPGNHLWSATPVAYDGQHVETATDARAWHHVKYVFPTNTDSMIHGDQGARATISASHFMVESFDQHCDNTWFDNILVTRASAEAFCADIDASTYMSVCPDISEWHSSIDMSDYVALPTCNVLVQTGNYPGRNCAGYCESLGYVCRHGQDNAGGCALDQAHDRQDMSQNGCLQSWGDQICGCAEPELGTSTSQIPPLPPPPIAMPSGSVPFSGYERNVCYQVRSATLDAVMHETDSTGDCHDGYPIYAQSSVRADSFRFVDPLTVPDGGQNGPLNDVNVVSIESCRSPGKFLRHCNYHIWAGDAGTGPGYDFQWHINPGVNSGSVQIRTTADQFGARDMEIMPGNDHRVTMVTDGNHEDWYLVPAHSDTDAALGLIGCYQDCSTDANGVSADRTCDEVVADVQTIEQCQAQCTAGSYAYMGMACPRAGAFECWCCNSFDDNSAGHNAAIPDEECSGGALTSGVNGNRQDHCSGLTGADNGGYILDGYNLGGHCRVAVYDMNVINTQGSNACDGINPASYTQECSDITEWHATIDMSSYSPTDVCTMLVSTSGSTCGDYCASQGRVCMHAQDNDGGCALAAAHDRQTTVNNGCDQTWGDQICGCGGAGQTPPPPSWSQGTPSIIEGRISTADQAYVMLTWDFTSGVNTPELFDRNLASPVGGDANGQHNDIVAVKLSRVCASSSFAVYGQDRDVVDTALRHIRVAYSLDGQRWTCYTQSDTGTEGGTPPFMRRGNGDTDCSEGPSHAPNGAVMNIPNPAQYVEVSFWGRTDVFEVELASCDGTSLAAPLPASIRAGSISVADQAYGMLTWDFTSGLATPELFDGDLATPVGGDVNGQHDDIVAVQLDNICSTSSFAVYGEDRDVVDTALRHVRVAYSLDGQSWTCYTQSDSGTEGGTPAFMGPGRGDTSCSEGPSHAPNGAVFNIPSPAQYVEFSFFGRTNIFEVELVDCQGVQSLPTPAHVPDSWVNFDNWELNTCFQMMAKNFEAVMHENGATGACSNGAPVYAQTSVRADSFRFVAGLCSDGGQCGDATGAPDANGRPTIVSIESCQSPGRFLRHCNYHIWAGDYGTGPNYDFMWQINPGADGTVQIRTTADQFGARDMEVVPGNDHRVTMVTDGNHEDWYLVPAHTDAEDSIGLVGCYQDCSADANGDIAVRSLSIFHSSLTVLLLFCD